MKPVGSRMAWAQGASFALSLLGTMACSQDADGPAMTASDAADAMDGVDGVDGRNTMDGMGAIDAPTGGTGPSDGPSDGPREGGREGPSEDGWEALMTGEWTLAPNSEEPDHCVKLEVEEDIFIRGIRPIHPPGTHHTFVALSDQDLGAGCTSAIAAGQLLYAAGLGSEGLNMPEGVAMKVPAGSVLNLSLHIYNPTEEMMSGTSGIEIQTMAAADVTAEVTSLLAGPLNFELPAATRSLLTHACEVKESFMAFALFPHMHQLGQHIKVSVELGGESTVLHDGDYDFAEQLQLPVGPLEFEPGDRIVTECTFENPRPTTVKFGESSDTEMCFSVFFRYPHGSAFCREGDITIEPAP